MAPVPADPETVRLFLGRWDYLRHPLLLAEIVLLGAVTRFASGPTRRMLRRAASELRVEVCHRQAVGRVPALLARAGRAPIRLNLGGGDERRPGWITVDLAPGAELRLDVRRPLPLPDGSCTDLYAEHFLEHLGYPDEVEAVLGDWHRVLARGGRLSLGVPDTAEALRAYVEGDAGYFARCRAAPWEPAWIETRLDQIDFHFRQQGLAFGQDHLYAYDRDTLVARLTAAGFVDIAERPFDPARDVRAGPGTLYVEARKP